MIRKMQLRLDELICNSVLAICITNKIETFGIVMLSQQCQVYILMRSHQTARVPGGVFDVQGLSMKTWFEIQMGLLAVSCI